MNRIGRTIGLLAPSTFVFFSIAIGGMSPLQGQMSSTGSKQFPLWSFDEEGHTCRAKGRLQDTEYCESRVMNEIIAKKKDAIPILISQLTDGRVVKEPIYDYWTQMTVGDVAYFVLNDLFTDSDWSTFNMPGLEALRTSCRNSAETCWHNLVRERGRKFVQDQWLTAWNANKDRIYWDTKARCFRLR